MKIPFIINVVSTAGLLLGYFMTGSELRGIAVILFCGFLLIETRIVLADQKV